MCCALPLATVLVIVWFDSAASDGNLDFAGTLNFGGPASFTGQHAATSEMLRRGFELWASHVNETKTLVVRGQVWSVNLIFEDDGSTKAGAIETMERLLPKLDVAIAPYTSGLTLAVLPTIVAAKKVMMVTAGSSEQIYSQGAPVIGLMPPASQWLASTMRLLKEQGAKSFGGLMHSENVFSVASCTAASLEAENLGLEPRGFESFAEGLKGATAQISKAKLRNPEIFIGCGHLNDAIFVALASKAVGFSPKAMVLLNAGANSFIDALGEATANDILSAAPWHAESRFTGSAVGASGNSFLANAQEFNKTFVLTYGSEPTYHAAAATAAGLVLSQAVTVAGSVEPESLIAAARAIRIDSSMFGPIAFDSKGQLVRENLAVLQIKNARVRAISNETITFPLRTWPERELELVNRECPAGSMPGANSSACELCLPGFFRTISMLACAPCEEGTYSASPGAQTCLPCLVPKNCYGCRASVAFSKCNHEKTDVVALPGFYRLPGTDGFSPCITPELCLGDNHCQSPNHGILCAQCDLGYTNSGQPGIHCTECPNQDLNWARVAIITWLYILYIILLVRSATHKKRHISKLFSIVMRLAVNYLQMASIAFLNCAFMSGSSLHGVIAMMDVTGDPMESIMDAGCIMRSQGKEPIYAYIIIGHCLCPAVLAANFIAHGIKRCLRLAFGIPIVKGFVDRCVSSCIISVFILHPIVTKLMFKGLDCQSLDTLRVSSNLDLTCDSEIHKKYAAYATIGVIVWACGIPLFAFITMFRVRYRLHEPDVRMRYGFLYNGFEGKFWFFELVYAYRKVLLILSMGVPFPSIRVAVLMCLGLVFLKVHLYYKPFDNRNFCILDRLETANLSAFNGTLLAALLYNATLMIPSVKSEDSDAARIKWLLQSDGFRIILVFIVFCLHARFIALASWSVFQELMIKPSKFIVDYHDILPAHYKIPTWRRWLALFAHDEKKLYFDDVRQELHVSHVSEDVRDFVAASLGEIVGSFISKVKSFHPTLLTVAIREAVQHVYVHKSHHLCQLQIEANSRTEARDLIRHGNFGELAHVMAKRKEGMQGSKDWYQIKDLGKEIDDKVLERLRNDGFSAEDLHNAFMRLQNGSDEQDQLFLDRVKSDHNSMLSLQSYLGGTSDKSGRSSDESSEETTMRARVKALDAAASPPGGSTAGQTTATSSASGLSKPNGLQELHLDGVFPKTAVAQDPFQMGEGGFSTASTKKDGEGDGPKIEEEKLSFIVDAQLDHIVLGDARAESTDSPEHSQTESSGPNGDAGNHHNENHAEASRPITDDDVVLVAHPADRNVDQHAPSEMDHQEALKNRLDDMLSHMRGMMSPSNAASSSTNGDLPGIALPQDKGSSMFDTNEILEQQTQHLGARPQGLDVQQSVVPVMERSRDKSIFGSWKGLQIGDAMTPRGPHDGMLTPKQMTPRGPHDSMRTSRHDRAYGDIEAASASAPASARPDSGRQPAPDSRPLSSRPLRRLDHPKASSQPSTMTASGVSSQHATPRNVPLRSILAPRTGENSLDSSRLHSSRGSGQNTDRRLRWAPDYEESPAPQHQSFSNQSESDSGVSHASCILGSSLMRTPEYI